MLRLSVLALAVLAASPAYAAPAGEPGTQGTVPGTTTPGTATPTAALDDAQIITVLMEANDAEIAEGKLVKSHASNADLKAYGERMVKDHTASNEQLETVSKQLDLSKKPSDISKTMQADAAKLQRVLGDTKGAAFDQAYIQGAVRDHQELLNRIDTFITQAKDPAVQSALTQIRPVVAAHLQEAQTLQRTLQTTTPGTR